MDIVLKSFLSAALTLSLASCATALVPTIGDDLIVVDDASGGEIALPDALDRSFYANEASNSGLPARSTLKDGQIFEPTPLGHPNATVVFTPQAYSSFRAGKSIFIYVRDADDPEGQVAVVPGSLWWPSAGLISTSNLNREVLGQKLVEEVELAAGGDTAVPIIFYCDRPDCWAPYNAALRLANTPYNNIAIYRGGTSAWFEAKLPLEVAKAPDWE